MLRLYFVENKNTAMPIGITVYKYTIKLNLIFSPLFFIKSVPRNLTFS